MSKVEDKYEAAMDALSDYIDAEKEETARNIKKQKGITGIDLKHIHMMREYFLKLEVPQDIWNVIVTAENFKALKKTFKQLKYDYKMEVPDNAEEGFTFMKYCGVVVIGMPEC